jgi:hypothetical protein
MIELDDLCFHLLLDDSRRCRVSKVETLKVEVTNQKTQKLQSPISHDHICE